ncbi:MAG: response regulator [Chitinispirillales bacterium]|jgi:PAS domain S-box-containing protein|nr:response regulator [Chitinispirillales bacterium]
MLVAVTSALLVISLAALALTLLKNNSLAKTLERERVSNREKVYWLESILDAVNSPITVTNKDMEWTFVNKAVEKFLGVTREEILGKKCYKWGANICNTENCGVTRLRNGHKETYFQQFGGDYHVLVSYLYDENNVLAGHVEVVYEDTAVIAREKKKFEALAHWYESILDAIPFPISVTDMDMKWSFVNATLEDATGLKRNGAIGRHCSTWGFDICGTSECSIARAKQGLLQTYFTQGETSYHITVAPLKDINGEAVGFLALLQDITAMERMTKQKADVEAASLAKTTFLANMSHEMRTPLNAISGMTTIGMSTTDIGRKNYCFTRILAASSHLLGVINDVLDMSKIEANMFELSPVEFEFEKMLQRAADIVNFRAEEKRQTLTVRVDKEVPKVVIADDQRLAQVVTNLLGNAVKFTPEEGTVSLDARLVGEENCICTLQISVKDTGIGIDAEQQKKLFASFQQAESSTSRKYGGTGLGLAISKSIVEMMGGEIWVDSAPEAGSTFTFTVKAKRAAGNGRLESECDGNANGKTPPDAAGRFAAQCVLLAEDVEINREIVLSLLEHTQLTIDCAENGEDAVRMFTEAPDKYAMIFMDVQMPKMDGYEATRRIRALDTKTAKTVPIVAMTANVFREDIENCIKAGMNSHIGKPIDIKEVLEKLYTYLPR